MPVFSIRGTFSIRRRGLSWFFSGPEWCHGFCFNGNVSVAQILLMQQGRAL